jgi:peptidoglycan/xylan/chitin deacetylase (PgdA/CDA1 family)
MRPRGTRSVIVMYHSIGDSLVSLPTEQFNAQMLWLKSHARVVSLDEMLRARIDANSPLRCVLSFDDGYENLYENAFPTLDRLNFPAVAYIPAGLIGETNQRPSTDQKGLSCHENILSWSEVREMSARGVTIGSHSFDHLDLTRLSEGEARGQLERSRTLITERTGQACHHFAYPWGRFNSQTVRAVDSVGYASAVTVIHKGITVRQHRLLLPRVNIWENYTLLDFRSTVIGEWDFISAYQLLRDFAPTSRP